MEFAPIGDGANEFIPYFSLMTQSHKTKQYLFALAKVLVLLITFGYIFYRLRNLEINDFASFTNRVFEKGSIGVLFLVLCLFLVTLNWFFDIIKWKLLVSTIEKIDFKTALTQSLASLTVSLATPNRFGEYGAKALFFEKEKRKKILLLNFFSNSTQLSATVIFGIIGMFYFLRNYEATPSIAPLAALIIATISLGIILYFSRKKNLWVKGFSVVNIIRFFGKLPKPVKLKVFALSIFRYLTFSSMFYGLLIFFGAEIEIGNAFSLIFAMYFMASIVPSIFIMDVLIRGGVAVWLFSFAGISDLIVLSTVMIMWILNFVIPSIIGSYYVLAYQPAAQ